MFESKARELLERLFARCNKLWMAHPAFDGPEASALFGEIDAFLLGSEISEDMVEKLKGELAKVVVRATITGFCQPALLHHRAFVNKMEKLANSMESRTAESKAIEKALYELECDLDQKTSTE